MLFHRRVGDSIGLHDFMGREAADQREKDLVLPTQRAQSGCGTPQSCSGPLMAQTSVISLLPQLQLPSHCRLLEHELAFGPSSVTF